MSRRDPRRRRDGEPPDERPPEERDERLDERERDELRRARRDPNTDETQVTTRANDNTPNPPDERSDMTTASGESGETTRAPAGALRDLGATVADRARSAARSARDRVSRSPTDGGGSAGADEPTDDTTSDDPTGGAPAPGNASTSPTDGGGGPTSGGTPTDQPTDDTTSDAPSGGGTAPGNASQSPTDADGSTPGGQTPDGDTGSSDQRQPEVGGGGTAPGNASQSPTDADGSTPGGQTPDGGSGESGGGGRGPSDRGDTRTVGDAPAPGQERAESQPGRPVESRVLPEDSPREGQAVGQLIANNPGILRRYDRDELIAVEQPDGSVVARPSANAVAENVAAQNENVSPNEVVVTFDRDDGEFDVSLTDSARADLAAEREAEINEARREFAEEATDGGGSPAARGNTPRANQSASLSTRTLGAETGRPGEDTQRANQSRASFSTETVGVNVGRPGDDTARANQSRSFSAGAVGRNPQFVADERGGTGTVVDEVGEFVTTDEGLGSTADDVTDSIGRGVVEAGEAFAEGTDVRAVNTESPVPGSQFLGAALPAVDAAGDAVVQGVTEQAGRAITDPTETAARLADEAETRATAFSGAGAVGNPTVDRSKASREAQQEVNEQYAETAERVADEPIEQGGRVVGQLAAGAALGAIGGRLLRRAGGPSGVDALRRTRVRLGRARARAADVAPDGRSVRQLLNDERAQAQLPRGRRDSDGGSDAGDTADAGGFDAPRDLLEDSLRQAQDQLVPDFRARRAARRDQLGRVEPFRGDADPDGPTTSDQTALPDRDRDQSGDDTAGQPFDPRGRDQRFDDVGRLPDEDARDVDRTGRQTPDEDLRVLDDLRPRRRLALGSVAGGLAGLDSRQRSLGRVGVGLDTSLTTRQRGRVTVSPETDVGDDVFTDVDTGVAVGRRFGTRSAADVVARTRTDTRADTTRQTDTDPDTRTRTETVARRDQTRRLFRPSPDSDRDRRRGDVERDGAGDGGTSQLAALFGTESFEFGPEGLLGADGSGQFDPLDGDNPF